MTGLCIRRAVINDAADIAEVHVRAWQGAYQPFMDADYLQSLSVEEREKGWINALSRPGKAHYLVAEENGGIKGFAVYGPARDDDLGDSVCELVALNVHPEVWRQGIGNRLLDAVIEEVSHGRYTSMALWVIDGNAPAIRLYESSGFIDTGISKTDDGHTGKPIKELRYSADLRAR